MFPGSQYLGQGSYSTHVKWKCDFAGTGCLLVLVDYGLCSHHISSALLLRAEHQGFALQHTICQKSVVDQLEIISYEFNDGYHCRSYIWCLCDIYIWCMIFARLILCSFILVSSLHWESQSFCESILHHHWVPDDRPWKQSQQFSTNCSFTEVQMKLHKRIQKRILKYSLMYSIDSNLLHVSRYPWWA